MIRIVICENEIKEANLLYDFVQNYFEGRKMKYEIKVLLSPGTVIKNADLYDIFLLDIELDDSRKMNGVGLGENIRQTNKTAKIIYITEHEEYRLAAQITHYFFYVKKPVIKKSIEEHLQEAIEYLKDEKKNAVLN